MTPITPELLPDALRACYEADVPALVHGSPGIGKSDLIHQFAAGTGCDLYDVRLPLLDPVDFGIPYTHGDGNQRKAGFAVTQSLFPTGERDGKAIVFLDEITAAPSAMQVAAYSLVLDRRVREIPLSPGTYVCGAGNLVTDGAVAKRLSTALGSRFFHFLLEPDHRAWEAWACDPDRGNMPIEIIAFLRFKPALFYKYDRDAVTSDQTFPCPRTWEAVAKVFRTNPPATIAPSLYAAGIGTAAATELSGFLSVWGSLPNADAVLQAPDTHPVPDDPAVKFALAGALAVKVHQANAARFHRFAERMGGEFEVLASRSAILHNAAQIKAGNGPTGYVQTQAYVDFCRRYSDL